MAASSMASGDIFATGSLGAFGRRCRCFSVVVGCAGATGSGCCVDGKNGLELKNDAADALDCCGYGINGLAMDNAPTCGGIQLEDDAPVGYCIPGNEPTAVAPAAGPGCQGFCCGG